MNSHIEEHSSTFRLYSNVQVNIMAHMKQMISSNDDSIVIPNVEFVYVKWSELRQ